jgi:hypothetical protein
MSDRYLKEQTEAEYRHQLLEMVLSLGPNRTLALVKEVIGDVAVEEACSFGKKSQKFNDLLAAYRAVEVPGAVALGEKEAG